jgi:hypothetical protein
MLRHDFLLGVVLADTREYKEKNTGVKGSPVFSFLEHFQPTRLVPVVPEPIPLDRLLQHIPIIEIIPNKLDRFSRTQHHPISMVSHGISQPPLNL